MLRPAQKHRPRPFGGVADVLFHIITHGDISVVLNLCLLDRATYEAIRMLEPHICGWFMRLHGADALDPILTMDPWTGRQNMVTIHSLFRCFERETIARDLSRHIVPTVWGAFTADQSSEMDFDAELRLANRLQRGLYVLFHMSDIARDTENALQEIEPSTPMIAERLLVLTQMLDEYRDFPPHRRELKSFREHARHIYTVLRWGHKEADIGRKRLEFRSHLDDQTEIDFHATLRMLRELTERMLLQHGPKDWHRDAKNEYSVISWFLLKQPPRTLAKLFLGPQDQCCGLEEKSMMDTGIRECCFSDPLDQYWRAWGKSPELGCQDCNCKRRVRSWSVKPALVDARGRDFNRRAERYLKEMWSQRHVGLHRTFTLGYFNTLLF